MSSQNRSWGVAEAKAHLSEVISRAVADGPQTIARNGREVVVVVSVQEWDRKTKRQGTLADFFMSSPLCGSGIDLERVHDGARELDL